MWVNWDSFILLIRELSWPMSFDLLPYTYLLKLPDIHALFLLVFQSYFASSTASLCSLYSSNSLEHPSVQRGASLARWCCPTKITAAVVETQFHRVHAERFSQRLKADDSLPWSWCCPHPASSERVYPDLLLRAEHSRGGTCGSELFLLVWHYIQIL